MPGAGRRGTGPPPPSRSSPRQRIRPTAAYFRAGHHLLDTLTRAVPPSPPQAHPKGRTPMRDHPPVTDLVMRARTGDQQAWDALVERYAPLVWSICQRYQLDAADAQDAGQSVWLHLVEQLDNLRDPA